MNTIVIGVRHKTAPIEIREKLAFSNEEIPEALRAMLSFPGIAEGAILSTCNRTEIYVTATDTEVGIRSLKAFLSQYKQFHYNQHMIHAFILLHEDAVMHLFRVASGLDSLVLAEGQIMAQVKEALRVAMEVGSSGEIIEKIFKTALSVGKAVRSETGIAQQDCSVAQAAYEFAIRHHPSFLEGGIALIGAGKMAEILLSALQEGLPMNRRRPEQIALVNRTPERTADLAQAHGITGFGWDELRPVVARYDTLFVATSSSQFVLQPEMLENMACPKLVFDISVPRNVNPVVGQLQGVSLYNTDDLSGYSGYTGEHRVQLIHQAHQIIEREYQKYHQWHMGRSATPVITRLRAWVETIRRNEVAGIEAHCPYVQSSCNVIDDLSRTLVNKILHDPTVKLRSTPQLTEIYMQAQFLNQLFQGSQSSCSGESSSQLGDQSTSSTKSNSVAPTRMMLHP